MFCSVVVNRPNECWTDVLIVFCRGDGFAKSTVIRESVVCLMFVFVWRVRTHGCAVDERATETIADKAVSPNGNVSVARYLMRLSGVLDLCIMRAKNWDKIGYVLKF